MASKKEQGWYQALIGTAVFAAGVALDDPALVGVGIGTAIGGVAQGLGGQQPAKPPVAAPPPMQLPPPGAAGASPTDFLQPPGAGEGVAQDAPREMSAADKKGNQQLLVIAVVALFLFSGGIG